MITPRFDCSKSSHQVIWVYRMGNDRLNTLMLITLPRVYDEFANVSAVFAGWEMMKTDKGMAYYVDHVNKRTSWDPPMMSSGGMSVITLDRTGIRECVCARVCVCCVWRVAWSWEGSGGAANGAHR